MSPTEELQTWLALEHEAVWTYGVIAARLEAVEDLARECHEAHRTMRDALLDRLRTLGAEPVGTQFGYVLPDLSSTETAATAARALEDRIAAAGLALVGVTVDDDRAFAVSGVTTAALAGFAWTHTPAPFPGLD